MRGLPAGYSQNPRLRRYTPGRIFVRGVSMWKRITEIFGSFVAAVFAPVPLVARRDRHTLSPSTAREQSSVMG